LKLLTINKSGPTRHKSFNKSSRSARILFIAIFLFAASSQNAVFSRGITGPALSAAKTPHIPVFCSCGYSPLLCSWMNPAVAAGPEGVGITHDDISFEDPFLWYSHRWVILTIAALIVAQFILITVLLIQRRRKALTEADLKKALTKAEQGDRMLSVLMENIPEGITISDANLNLTRVSGYGLEILGGNHEG
jgi:PAS domain-containing protein